MNRLSKQEIKQINRYKIKKYRQQDQRFLAEGSKVVSELIDSAIEVERIVVTQNFIDKDKAIDWSRQDFFLTDEKDFQKLSNQKQPDGVMAVCSIPQYDKGDFDFNEWTIALDALNDPGNLGTIIRLADWFGVSQIICDKDTVDAYNSKVIQASMGSIARVKLIYVDLQNLFSTTSCLIYAADLVGESIYSIESKEPGVILIGNESHGIKESLLKMSTQKITIPRLGKAESLNAGVATGIILSHLVV